MTAQVTVLGRLGRDVEIRETQNGTQMAVGSVAVDKGYGDSKKTIWWKVIVFGRRADAFFQHGKKGKLVMASGEFDLEEYTTRDGVLKQAPCVNATNLEWYQVSQAREHEEALDTHRARGNAAPAASGYGTTQNSGAQGAPRGGKGSDVPF